MMDEVLLQAIDRLERAVSRAEAAAAARPPLPAPLPAPVPAYEERHRLLRGEAEAALARLDRLLEAEPA